ncbi:CPBP family intramembrane glutamic endopeptidase [Curtobacterium flaccumfaciens]|uniref:CPBP family intramembrane glutamic endopeptidase n=1 Tax=Curtobacterium flaccumfaciens TaxID=2035 RepID=UPI00188C8690|nr:CPBP family intramembrane glutamic endopeptidase [Curtobacterium flaccumfaciens]MBF4629344.1 CPBP family intramembrane metalloprotease [Curtobacterium flaccumfaciens]
MSTERSVEHQPGHRAAPWVSLTVFLAVSLGGAWAVVSPLWASGVGLSSPWAAALLPAMMFTPAVAVLVVALIERKRPAAALRELGVWPLRPAKRVVGLTLIGLLGVPLVIAAGIAIAAVLGWVDLDLRHLSGFRAELRASAGDAADTIPVRLVVIIQLVSIPFAALFNGVLAFGEEVGWRGWLLPRLRAQLGTWPSILVTGAIWGAWHSPLILLGYNFAQPNIAGVSIMVVACVTIGTLFGWLRLRSGSLWPSVFAHGALNASAGLVVLFSAAGHELNPILAGPLGVATWFAVAAIVAALGVFRQFEASRLGSVTDPSAEVKERSH